MRLGDSRAPLIENNAISLHSVITPALTRGRTADTSAIYVNRNDPTLFADAILEILDDPTRRQKMGQAALERIRSLLHWGLSRDRLLEAYSQVIQRSAPLSQRKPKPDPDVKGSVRR
jgi:glycosyltransferase involved in cell wall biosynthesis